MKINSYAKVNLNLKVFPKDNSGYHKIESLITKVENLYDTLIIEKNSLAQDVIECNIEQLTKSNFIFDVLNILRKNNIITEFFTIRLEKKIPIGSGLGGGTSNAIALAKYLIGDCKISQTIWNEIALKVGYDSYYFISGFDVAIVKGYGEIVEKTESNIKIFKEDLIFTNINCETKAVYEQFDKVGYNQEINYLTKAAVTLYPELEQYTKEGIMSGSGSTFIKKKIS
ncbi:GHMP family kinase ATP-binding protein [Spiroplasma culicicola]|uniref:4-diphosphocytidyl-2-C-methyl-D-erythritol kinase n=1 Tax=Spiroplasma culicicola AES-1 TaxID=1276246 RepID=W6A8Q1_9MOLU|nr:hypothetical protein [Spiroplasma culicicola]AHI53397.1 4-diphosphocytidyl-2-C-methyl-D-erythritol kinase [Spiroplasma culicicola AES-1]